MLLVPAWRLLGLGRRRRLRRQAMMLLLVPPWRLLGLGLRRRQQAAAGRNGRGGEASSSTK